MKNKVLITMAALLLPVFAAPAQEVAGSSPQSAAASASDSSLPAMAIQKVFLKNVRGVRAYDQRGVNVFEAPKVSGAFAGPTIDIGAAFSQSYQSLKHSNAAAPRIVAGKDQNLLIPIGAGLPLASANLVLNAQLASGVVVSLENYLAARGHEQFYVKGGFLQIDESPINVAPLNALMKYVTLKIGMFENNFGDTHFRRSDAGQAIYNPFVGNYIVDPFTTEAGAEVYVRSGSWMAMGAVTSGEMRGSVATPEKRGWARYGKVGFDRQLNSDLRVRLTGSLYKADRSLNQTIYSGDRPGSRYYDVLVDSVGRDRWSGTIQPGFRTKVQAVQINPFVKFRGLEFFGTIDEGKGQAATETSARKLSQRAADLLYRFADDRLYIGGRYNTARMRLANSTGITYTGDVGADRSAFAAGWYVTPLLLLKAEYVNQKYVDFPTSDRRSGGKFSGLMMEGVVAF